jgi:hypothetical protein
MKNRATNNFIDKLTELTLLYEIEIGGCGCCESPWLRDMKTGDIIEGDHYGYRLKWDEINERYYFG